MSICCISIQRAGNSSDFQSHAAVRLSLPTQSLKVYFLDRVKQRNSELVIQGQLVSLPQAAEMLTIVSDYFHQIPWAYISY